MGRGCLGSGSVGSARSVLDASIRWGLVRSRSMGGQGREKYPDENLGEVDLEDGA